VGGRCVCHPLPTLSPLWSATQSRATYGSLCGMPACGQGRGMWCLRRAGAPGVAPRAYVRVYARVLVPPKVYIIHIHTSARSETVIKNNKRKLREGEVRLVSTAIHHTVEVKPLSQRAQHNNNTTPLTPHPAFRYESSRVARAAVVCSVDNRQDCSSSNTHSTRAQHTAPRGRGAPDDH